MKITKLRYNLTPRNLLWFGSAGLLVLLLAYISYQYFPLFYDESWVYQYWIQHGLVYTAINVNGANHVFESLLIALVPNSLVHYEPKAIRLPNLLTISLLIFVIFLYLKKVYKQKLYFWIWYPLLLALLFSSPQFAYYLFIVRGYLLASCLAFLGIYLRTNKGRWELASDILLVLSVYSIPSQAYLLPGIFFIDCLVIGFKKALIRSLRMGLIVLALHSPGYKILLATRSMLQGFHEFFHYSSMLLSGTVSYKNQFNAICVGVLVLFLLLKNLYSVISSKGKNELQLLSCYLVVSIFSFIAVSEVGNLLKIMPCTWQRNATFFSLFLGTSLLLSFSGRIRSFITAAILVNGVIGFSALYSTALSGKPWDYPIQEPGTFGYLQATTMRKTFPNGSVVSCDSHSTISCCMYGYVMNEKKILILDHFPPGVTRDPGKCVGVPHNATFCCIVLPGEKVCRALCRADGSF